MSGLFGGGVGSANLLYTAPVSGAVTTTLQGKAAQQFTVQDLGAKGDGTTNDGSAFSSVTSDVAVPGASYSGPSGFTFAAVRYRGTGSSSLISIGSGSSQGVSIQAGTVLDSLKISDPGTGAAVSSSTGGVVDRCTITATQAPAYDVLGSNPVGSHVRFSTLTTPNYGVLVNTQGQASPTGSKASIIGSDISVVNADAIELNMPSVSGVASFQGTISALNFLANTAASGGTSAGFNIGVASPLYNVVMGNVSLDSRLEQIHIEDSQRCTTVFGNVGVGRSHGINVSPAGSQNATPLSIMGNALESSQATPTGVGVYLFWTTPGSLGGTTIMGNVLRNYAQGIYCGGVASGALNTIALAQGNSLYHCTYGIAAQGSSNQGTVRQSGTNAVIGASTSVFNTTLATRFGKIITDQDISHTAIITSSSGYSGTMPSMCDGFEFPPAGITATSGGTTCRLFTIGGPCHGRVKVQFKGVSPNTDWCHYSADINWDGTTMTFSNVLSRVHGQVSAITVSNIGGNPVATVTSTANTFLPAVWVEFDGEYWDA